MSHGGAGERVGIDVGERSGAAAGVDARRGAHADVVGRVGMNLREQSGAADGVDERRGAHAGAEASDGAAARSSATSTLGQAMLRAQAKAALTGLGWKPAIAQAAVAAAVTGEGPFATLEPLIFAALRHCPAPKA